MRRSNPRQSIFNWQLFKFDKTRDDSIIPGTIFPVGEKVKIAKNCLRYSMLHKERHFISVVKYCFISDDRINFLLKSGNEIKYLLRVFWTDNSPIYKISIYNGQTFRGNVLQMTQLDESYVVNFLKNHFFMKNYLSKIIIYETYIDDKINSFSYFYIQLEDIIYLLKINWKKI